VAAATVAVTLLVLTPVFEPLPKAVLAAIVLVAVMSLIDLRAASSTLRVGRADGLVLVVTFLATLAAGVALGLLIGVVVNLAVHVARGMRPALVEVGRVRGTRLYRSVDRFATVTDPAGVILRLDGPLDFLSVQQVTGQLRRLAAERPELTWLVLDTSGVTGMDSTGVHALHDVQAHLAEAQVTLHLATLRGPQRDVIRRAGLWSELMEGSCHADVPAALGAIGLPDDDPMRSPAANEPRPEGLW
jgi:SulP family sulfate permease